MARVNDPAIVLREYATEERFLARRLAAWAELQGPLVEDAAVEAIAEGRPSRVLDAGCGTGDHSERIQREVGAQVTGLDLSPRMAELTHARGLDALMGNIEALPFAHNAFDCVAASRVLYHVPDLDRGLAEIARVLRPGGRLIAITYSDDHLRELTDLLGDPLEPSPFSAENGVASLRRHFDLVEQRDFSGNARFRSRGDLRMFLGARAGSPLYGEFAEADLASRLGAVTEPFDTTYRHALFIGHKPS